MTYEIFSEYRGCLCRRCPPPPAPAVLCKTSSSRSFSKTDGFVSWELWAAFVEVICQAPDGVHVTSTLVWQRAIELGHQRDGFAGVRQHHAHPNIDINAEGAFSETNQYFEVCLQQYSKRAKVSLSFCALVPCR